MSELTGGKNAIAVEGTNIPKTVVELCEKKTTTAGSTSRVTFDGMVNGPVRKASCPAPSADSCTARFVPAATAVAEQAFRAA